MNLDRLRAIAEKRFQALRAGSTSGTPEWRYMSDQERLQAKNPAPAAVTPAIVKQLQELRHPKPNEHTRLAEAIRKVRNKKR